MAGADLALPCDGAQSALTTASDMGSLSGCTPRARSHSGAEPLAVTDTGGPAAGVDEMVAALGAKTGADRTRLVLEAKHAEVWGRYGGSTGGQRRALAARGWWCWRQSMRWYKGSCST